jgi:hypothetical protein
MVAALPVALVMLAQAAPSPTAPPAKGPVAGEPASKAASNAVPACSEPNADSQTIVICTERPQGYRLNPDVMEAKRETRGGSRPVRPGGKVIPDCRNVGPAPCTTAGINIVGAALTAVEMAKRAASGEDVGGMFVTDPHPTEYQLYLMAKARREAEEEEQRAALEKANAARAKEQAKKPAEAQPADPSGK